MAAIKAHAPKPRNLLTDIKLDVAMQERKTWKLTPKNGYLTHKSKQLLGRGWFKATVLEGGILKFTFLRRKDGTTTAEEEAAYESELVQLLCTHYRDQFTHLTVQGTAPRAARASR